MSYYTDRAVFVKKEGTWGTQATPTSNDVINYLLGYEMTSAERRAEEFVIGGSRDSRSRTWLQREVSGLLDFQPVSGRIFYYVLGKALGGGNTSGESASLPCTITPGSVVPGLTIWREIRSPNEYLRAYGNKIDRLELVIEQGEDVTCSCDLVGKDVSNTSFSWMDPNIDWNKDPLAFYNCTVKYINPGGTLTVDHLRSCRTEIRNNLEARFSAGSGTFSCIEIREGGLEVAGRLVIDYPLDTFASYILGRNEGTLTITLGNSYGTMTITLNNIIFEELPDAIRGLDAMEMDLPFVARKPSGDNIIKVVLDYPGVNTLGDLKF
jgi:hypothetical protein